MTLSVDAKRGVAVSYGTRTTDGKFGAEVPTEGFIKEASWDFTYADLPTSSTSKLTKSIPAGSIPLEAYFQVTTAFAGGTSYDIDFVDSAGSAIGSGSDKLWDALLLAEIDASEVSGALLASTHTGINSGNALGVKLASAGQLKVAATGTFTAGAARITVRYLQVPA